MILLRIVRGVGGVSEGLRAGSNPRHIWLVRGVRRNSPTCARARRGFPGNCAFRKLRSTSRARSLTPAHPSNPHFSYVSPRTNPRTTARTPRTWVFFARLTFLPAYALEKIEGELRLGSSSATAGIPAVEVSPAWPAIADSVSRTPTQIWVGPHHDRAQPSDPLRLGFRKSSHIYAGGPGWRIRPVPGALGRRSSSCPAAARASRRRGLGER